MYVCIVVWPSFARRFVQLSFADSFLFSWLPSCFVPLALFWFVVPALCCFVSAFICRLVCLSAWPV